MENRNMNRNMFDGRSMAERMREQFMRPEQMRQATPPQENKQPQPPVQQRPQAPMRQQEQTAPRQEQAREDMPRVPQVPQTLPAQRENMHQMPQVKDSDKEMTAQFPEIYYKLQPYIMKICDQVEANMDGELSQEMIEQLSDLIFEDVKRLYPDIADYICSGEIKDSDMNEEAVQTVAIRGGYVVPMRGGWYWRRPFRRRGMGKDLIDILILSELARRRRPRRRYRF